MEAEERFRDEIDEEFQNAEEDTVEPDTVGNTQGVQEQEALEDTIKNLSMFRYLKNELTRGYMLEHDQAKFTEKRERVYTFMKIPRELEKFMLYGFFQCADAFLHVFTFLPLRFFLAIIKVILNPCGMFSRRGARVLEPAEVCDILKVIILICCSFLLKYVDTSMMYHIIRGQTIIKLYIFFNMLDIADKLFSSFGQDILDALFWTANEPRDRRRQHLGVIPHMIMAIVYVFFHSVLVLFQAITLNVAFNSHNKSLLTIMMSNNFVEVKGTVFKKFERNNLFQMSCADVRERFHYCILLLIVGIRNMAQFSWNMDHLWVLIPDMAMVLLAEMLVDWVKHAFITKFNEIQAEIYQEYTVSIAYDMASSRQKNAFSDHTDLVSKRMGFVPFPHAVLLIRIIYQSVSYSGPVDLLIGVLLYLCMITFKVLNSIVLLGKACDYIKEQKSQSEEKEKEKLNKSNENARRRSVPAVTKRSKFRTASAGSFGNSPTMRRRATTPYTTSMVTLSDNSILELNTSETFTTIHNPNLAAVKPMFSNSTVSLNSVELNEEFIKDSTPETETLVPEAVNDPFTIQKKPKPQKPLSEVDRFTMVSSSIV